MTRPIDELLNKMKEGDAAREVLSMRGVFHISDLGNLCFRAVTLDADAALALAKKLSYLYGLEEEK